MSEGSGITCCDVVKEDALVCLTEEHDDVTRDGTVVADVRGMVETMTVSGEACGTEDLDLLFGGEDTTVQMVGTEVVNTFKDLG